MLRGHAIDLYAFRILVHEDNTKGYGREKYEPSRDAATGDETDGESRSKTAIAKLRVKLRV